jgi:Flp pilus assembly protein TadG
MTKAERLSRRCCTPEDRNLSGEHMGHNAWDGANFPKGAGAGRGRRARGRHGETGATAVEFTLVLAVVMMLLFGVIQFGIAYQRHHALHAAAREGGRFAASSQATIGQIQERTRGAIDVFNTDSNQFVNPCPADPSTMAAQKFCINVLRRDSASSAPTLLTNGSTFQPCNLASGKSVLVRVYYRMPIQIPFWAVTVVTAQGVGEFRCES